MLLGELDLNAAPATGALSTLSGAIGKPLAGLSGLGAAAGAAGGPLAVLAAVATLIVGSIAGLKDAMDLGGTFNDMKLRTGDTVGDLVILTEAFTEAGLGANGAEPFFLKLQSALGGVNEEGEKTSDAFEALKISADELRGLNSIGQIEALQKGFAGIADQADKVQAARNLFGKSGGQMLSLLGDPSVLEDARRRAGPLAELLEKNATSFDKLGDVVGSLKLNFQEFFAGALSKIAPEATSIADALSDIDFVGIGEAVGSLAKVFLMLADVLAGPLGKAVNFVSEGLSSIFGSGSSASAGLADKYRGFSKLMQEQQAGNEKSLIGSLQKVGGGGIGGGAGDPLLAENRRQTQLLQIIADRVRSGAPPTYPSLEAVPV